jgi:hypothetical protein
MQATSYLLARFCKATFILSADDIPRSFLNSSIKQDTNTIKSDVEIIKKETVQISAIKEDTSQITAMHLELMALKSKVDAMNPHDGKRLVLEHFLDESTAYTESVADYPDIFEITSERGLEPEGDRRQLSPFKSPEDETDTSLSRHGLKTSRPQSSESTQPVTELSETKGLNTANEDLQSPDKENNQDEQSRLPLPRGSDHPPPETEQIPAEKATESLDFVKTTLRSRSNSLKTPSFSCLDAEEKARRETEKPVSHAADFAEAAHFDEGYRKQKVSLKQNANSETPIYDSYTKTSSSVSLAQERLRQVKFLPLHLAFPMVPLSRPLLPTSSSDTSISTVRKSKIPEASETWVSQRRPEDFSTIIVS